MLRIKNYIKPVLSIMILCGTATQLNATWSDYFSYLNPVRAYTALSRYVSSRNLKNVLTTIEYQIEYEGKSTQEQWNQVKQLINSGADINTVTPSLFNSALLLAASDGDQDTIKNLNLINFLIEKGIDQSLRNIKNSTFQDIKGSLANNLKNVLTTIENQNQGTEKQWNQVKQLINSGADINTVTYKLHNSALHLAASDPDKETIQKLDIINFLTTKGIDQSLQNSDDHTFKDIEEFTQKIVTPPRTKQSSVIRTQNFSSSLLPTPPQTKTTTESLNNKLQQQLNKLTTLDREGWETILQLINQGADINTQNKRGDTALHIVVAESDFGRMHTLLGYKSISVNLKNNDGLTPLKIAETSFKHTQNEQDEQIINMLKKRGAISFD